ELAVLPANHRIVDAMIVSVSGFTTEKADVGIMSGDVGSTATGRTSGDEIFDGVALTAFARMTAGTAVALAASDKNRSIGVKLDTQTAGAGQKIVFQFLLTQ